MKKIVLKFKGTLLLTAFILATVGGMFSSNMTMAQSSGPDASYDVRRDHYYADRDCYVQCLYFSVNDCNYYAGWHWDCSAGGPSEFEEGGMGNNDD